MNGAWLEDLTWVEAAERFKAGQPVIIPIGARSKEHGHHLPLKTDYLLAREFGQRIADALPVVVAPVVDFGYYPAFVNYPGSQNLHRGTDRPDRQFHRPWRDPHRRGQHRRLDRGPAPHRGPQHL